MKTFMFSFFCIVVMCTVSSCSSANSTQSVTGTLNVTRSSPLIALPALHSTITDKKAIQQLYQAAYNLPPASTDKRNCPNDLGIVYHLSFSQDKNTHEEIDVEASGCLILTIGQRLLQEDNQFLDLVVKTIHVDPLVPLYH